MAGVFKRRGRWVADFVDQHGKRHQLFRRTKAEAEAALVKHGAEVQAGTYEALARTTTLGTLATQYLEAKGPTWRRNTADLNKWVVEKYILHAEYGLGRLRVASVNLATCETFRARLMASNPDLSPRTVNLAMTQLGALLRYGSRCHLRADNPAAFVARLEEPRRQVEILTAEQVEHLLAALPFERDRMLAELALRTGCRWGELTALTWGDLDEARGMLRVRHTNSHRASRKHFTATGEWPGGPKTASSAREVPLSPRALALLKRWRLASGRPAEGALLFVNRKGGPLDGKNWRLRVWQPALTAAEIGAACTFHVLRHCFASRLLSEGAPLDYVAKVCGHSSPTITARVYRQWIPDADGRHAALIDRALDGTGY